MRDIKFRALYEGVWYYQTLEEVLTITLAAFRNGNHKTQFTGLKDKNGNEIYEGDICLKHHAQDLFPGRKPDNGVVKWVSFGARFTHETIGEYPHYCELYENLTDDRYDRSLFEIIGNIYENPELIKSFK